MGTDFAVDLWVSRLWSLPGRLLRISPDRKRGFYGQLAASGSIKVCGSLLGAGVVMVLISTIVSEQAFDWGWRIPVLCALTVRIIGLYLRHAWKTPAFQQPVINWNWAFPQVCRMAKSPLVRLKKIATKLLAQPRHVSGEPQRDLPTCS